MKFCKQEGKQIMVAIFFATMMLASGYIFKGSENANVILTSLIAAYFVVANLLDKNHNNQCR